MAGMPRGVVATYRQFLESLVTYNVIAGVLGHGHRRACGIPQGCPFSMMVVALIMRLWLVMMKTMSVMPRVLADDVLLIATGRDMLKQFAKALDATHSYLHAMGARVASAKSYNFASVKTARDWLDSTVWEGIQERIQVVKDF